MRSLLLVFVLALAVAGCGIEGTATVDEPATAEVLGAGQVLYGQYCAECHGSDLRGTDKGPSHLSVVYEPSHHGDGAFLVAVQRGTRSHHWDFGDMPAIPGLDIDDVSAITAYVRSIQEQEGFEPYPP